ncbi:MAG: response regulator transcription factor [Chlorobi bacterium]|nr:response regulator transcription factor [Chlorobiota bacterium]
MKILVVEDEKELALSVKDYLTNIQDMACDVAMNLEKATELTELFSYDCIVLDLGLPDGNGLDLIQKIKEKRPDIGIIIVSARDTIDNRIDGLNLGADDYLTKPFNLSELNARIFSVYRRIRFEGKTILRLGEMEINTMERSIKVNNEELELTKSEYNILEYFLTNQNKVLTKASIAEHILGEYSDLYVSYDFMYSHIKNLRKKLLDKGCPDYIKTVYGIGYKFVSE